ncbi:molybdopterin converting factor subunit 1 [Lutibaculum baratangense]|uniref:Molybdenum cofactor biosynthesis protein MoaD n=1 Tax=Lutibaculum baratangense AMV1 TaxID=631454 RepID=V4QTV2_9HYPH|nr:molybdopterin converting factor subunit 1 [Lutibaculum baratangense]ESR23202.1 Molybdenum cofactor biosynthesis protein MoaD [Lutibaculum baratangense AMV1]
MKIRYFAWLRERTGIAEEEVRVPDEVQTVSGLVAWLSSRGENYAYAFENPEIVRVAVDRVHAKEDRPISGASEVAFFPPMTGG